MKFKYFVCGFLVAVLLMGGVYTFAEGAFVRQINANIGGVDIVLNGVKVIPMDGNGKVVQPVAFDGTTYVPIRFLTAALNMKLVRIANTIYIGKDQKINSIYLSELKPFDKSASWNGYGLMGGWKSTSNPYDNSFSTISYAGAGTLNIANQEHTSVSTILCDGTCETRATYNLGGKYSRISGYFGVDDFSTDNGQGTGEVEIYANGKLIYNMTLKRGQSPAYFEPDISDATLLTIVVKGAITTDIFYGQKLPTSQTVCDLYDLKLYPE